jgi:hypothetical protein
MIVEFESSLGQWHYVHGHFLGFAIDGELEPFRLGP